MIELEGYSILETVHSGKDNVTYRAVREADGQTVILKTSHKLFPAREHLQSLRHEYVIAGDLDIKGLPKFFEFHHRNNRPILVMEDLGGISLRHWMAENKPAVWQFLSIAEGLVRVIYNIHEAGIIHKDIKPENIVLDPVSLNVYLVDLGISTKLKRNSEAVQHPSRLEGTLEYISPEQTGRINRSIDYRTDFYSLGVTLYELSSQTIPFESNDPMEIIHGHLAKYPDPPHLHNNDLPPQLSDIILKLMAKIPEERYQSAKGILEDIKKCKELWKEDGQIGTFELAQSDINVQFRIPEKLYGREKESTKLQEALLQAVNGSLELCLISGPSGMGKTSLLGEIYEPAVRSRCEFVSGSFDVQNREIPYKAIMEALENWTSNILKESEEAISSWRERILEVLGANGQVLIQEVPLLETIIGKQPDVPDLPTEESRHRFELVIRSFFEVISQREHPLVMFLDDLQWADAASLELLENLYLDRDLKHILIVGAYRDTEVTENDQLWKTMDRLRVERPFREIRLVPLQVEHINELLSETLKRGKEDCFDLARLVKENTDGTPFFVVTFVQSLYDEGIFEFSNDSQAWNWDAEAIQRIGFTDNVLELILGRIDSLSPPALDLLKLASCLGQEFDGNLLFHIAGVDSDPFSDQALELLQGQFLKADRECYKWITSLMDLEGEEVDADEEGLLGFGFRFSHGKVQQAIYSLVDEPDKAQVHHSAGKFLLEHTQPPRSNAEHFLLVSHLNRGISRIRNQEEKDVLCELNIDAALRAIRSNAYESALSSLDVARGLIRPDSWKTNYERSYRLFSNRAKSLYLLSRPNEAEADFNLVIRNANSRYDKIKMYNEKVLVLISAAEVQRAIEVAAEGLLLFNIKLPNTRNQARMAMTKELIISRFRLIGKTPEKLKEMDPIPDKDIYELVSFLGRITVPAYSISPELLGFVILKSMNICLKHGNPAPSSGAYHNYGIILSLAFGDYKLAYRFSRMNLELFDNPDLPSEPGDRFEFGFYHFIAHWRDSVRKDIPNFLDLSNRLLENGDLFWGNLVVPHRLWTNMTLGESLDEIYREATQGLRSLKRRNATLALKSFQPRFNSLRALQGLLDPPWEIDDEDYSFRTSLNEMVEEESSTLIDGVIIPKIQLAWFFDYYDEIPEFLELGEKHMEQMAGIYYGIDYYVYMVLCLAEMYPSATKSDQKLYRKIMMKYVKNMKKWSDRMHENYGVFHEISKAALDRVLGREAEAIKGFKTALASSRKYGFQQFDAIANEMLGRLYMDAGDENLAKNFLDLAREVYDHWGAHAKVTHMTQKYIDILPEMQVPIARRATHSIAFTTVKSNIQAFDLESILKASTTISQEIRLEDMLDRMMRVLVENAGAERGFLVLERDSRFQIEASMENDRVETGQHIEIEDNSKMPESVVHFVLRTKETLVIQDAAIDQRFQRDPIISQRKIRSVLCIPIISQGNLIGVIYLDNSLISGAFTHDRIRILSLLSGQIAVSLQNALLYENLEQKVEERTREIEKQSQMISHQRDQISEEKKKAEDLLRNILPFDTAEELKKYGKARARRFEDATVLFSDIQGFTAIAEALKAEDLVEELDELFSAFDQIMDKYGLEKIKTIGDAYMAVGGVPRPMENSALSAVQAGLEMQEFVRKFSEEKQKAGKAGLYMRVGINTGSLVAGVVGYRKFAYDVWGSAVVLAARMESSGELGKVNISESTQKRIAEHFECHPRGKVEAKGMGEVEMYFVGESKLKSEPNKIS